MSNEIKNAEEAQAPKKTPKAKKEPKPAWTPSQAVSAAAEAIASIDHFDKKGIAFIVKVAIDLRTSAKASRELAEVSTDESK
jgi:hypothetical protein